MRRLERERGALPAAVRDLSRAVSVYMTTVFISSLDVSRRIASHEPEKKRENSGNRSRGAYISKGKKLTDNCIILVYKNPYFVVVVVIAVCLCFSCDSLNQ